MKLVLIDEENKIVAEYGTAETKEEIDYIFSDYMAFLERSKVVISEKELDAKLQAYLQQFFDMLNHHQKIQKLANNQFLMWRKTKWNLAKLWLKNLFKRNKIKSK